ncbi:MAG: UrcA family protein [Phenylobacterium sp.]
MNHRIDIAAALAALTVLAGGAAHAQDGAMTVRINDLNVAGEPGARIALNRIRQAAVQFCGEGETRDLGRMVQQKGCVKQMTRKAVETLNAPRVTSLYDPHATILLAQTEAQSR